MAFRDIAPLSDACTSSSKKPCYDVFINHRGKDVKHTFASTIYNMLDLMRVKAFLDEEELEVGDSFPHAIEEAMRSASVHIAIFSPSYAESPWCLEELCFMLQIEVTIIPVFYRVQPSDLRYVTKGIYAEAFRQLQSKKRHHSEEPRYNQQKIEKWKEALSQVSNLCGLRLDGDNCNEGKLLREIVETALHKMKKVPLGFAVSPIGLEEAVQDIERKVESSIGSQNVHIVGIVGLGGAGKTTLAKELYNRKGSSISRSCFLSNVKDAASTKTLHKLQETLLNDLHIQHPTFHNIHQGMGMLVRYLRSMTVLIVLDDVDDLDQMDALLPEEMRDKLGQGSFIIVTTRDVGILTASRISFVYHMKQLDYNNAKQLFCRHAFSRFENLLDNFANFENLIERFVGACGGLPLSLKVLGAMMNGKSRPFWESQLAKISRILPPKITECLKVSYDALDPEEQNMFLDVACFFIGGEKSLVVAIWDGSGWSGEVGWEILVNKCLIGLNKKNRIEMHDHLRDLGRQIASEVTPHRLWKEEQINVQGGRTLIRGILVGLSFRPYDWFNFYPLSLEHFMEKIIKRPSLPELQLLAVNGNDFRERFASLSRDLVWLHWHHFYGTNLPSWLSLANLRVLELLEADNLKELWHDNVQPPLQLRELIITITGKRCFQGLPGSIGHLRHLRKIVLNGKGSVMRSLPEEFCHLESLEFLQLSEFPRLLSLPDDFGKLINLQSLKLWRVNLLTLPHSFKHLMALHSLSIEYSRSFMFTSEMLDVLEFMTELQVLRIAGCPQLEELPHLTTQLSLRKLDLRGSGLRELPNNMGQLTKLETLEIGSGNLTSLPESLGALSCLTSLKILSCYMLESLPEALWCLSNLQYMYIVDTPVVEIGLVCNLKSLKFLYLTGTRVCRISIADDCCPSLEELYIIDNNNLTEITTLPGNVREIVVQECHKMKNMRGIGGLLNLKSLEVKDCPDLEVLPCPTYMQSVGHKLDISRCPKVGIIT